MAGITVLETLEADVPTPATDKDTIFVDPTNGLGYKDDTGTTVYTGTGSGSVTNTGTLTDHALIVGNGGVDVSALASLGTTTQVLHGNASGDPTFGAVSLTADVSGDLPYANLVPATAASLLIGRGSASGAGDFQEITLGSGMAMTGTVLSATGSGGSVTTTGSPASGNLTKFTGASSISNADLTGDVTTSGTVATTIAANAVTTAKILDANVTLAKIANAAASSKLVGSGASGSGAPYVELTVGTGLSVSGTTLSATGSGGTVTTTGSPASGNLTKFTGAGSISNADLTGDVTTSGTVATTIANGAVTLAKIANAAANSKVVGSGASGSGAAYSELTLGTHLSMASTTLNATIPTALGITIDGGGIAITTGVKGYLSVPFACTITANTLLSTDAAATVGSIVIDIWKDTYANYPPTIADTITASAKPTLSSANKSTDSTLTGWTVAVAAGDVLAFNVDSATTVTRVTLVLAVTV